MARLDEAMSPRRDNIILRLGALGCTENVGAMSDGQVERHWTHHLFIENGRSWGPGTACRCGCGQTVRTAQPVR